MSKTPKFDVLKLTNFLKSIGIDIGDTKEIKALGQLMDKYDMMKLLDDYENVGTKESPVLAKTTSYQTIQYIGLPHNAFYYALPSWPMAVHGFVGTDTATEPVESPHAKLKDKISNLENVEPVKVASPTSQAVDSSPDYMHTLTGWRAWNVEYQMLRSVGAFQYWQPKQALKAHCVRDAHAAPQMKCSCGYWSFKTLDQAKEAVKDYTTSVTVIGTVEIWGRVIECSKGYRSEFAYPKELWLLQDGLEYLSWEYGVPVRRIQA